MAAVGFGRVPAAFGKRSLGCAGGNVWRHGHRFAHTVRQNDAWTRDDLQIGLGVRVRQEATDWERALPYGLGAVVWDGAFAFCDLVEALEVERVSSGSEMPRACGFWHGRRILELGSGCGAAGLSVAAAGARSVCLTDREALLPLMDRNLELNRALFPNSGGGDAVTLKALDWSDAAASDFESECGRPFDIVIGTDLVDADPDSVASGKGPYVALQHALEVALGTLHRSLVLLTFEERGPLTMERLGGLFAPLAASHMLWEYEPPTRFFLPKRGQRCPRHLCLHALSAEGQSGNVAFAEWRRTLGCDSKFRLWHASDFDPVS